MDLFGKHRKRTKGVFTLSNPYVEMRSDYNCSGLPVANGNLTRISVGEVKSMDDVVIPRFRERVAKGEIFFNPMLSTKDARECSADSGYIVRGNVTPTCVSPLRYDTYSSDGGHVPNMVSSSPFWANDGLVFLASNDASDIRSARIEASTRCLANVGRSDSNFYESFAERKRTIEMLATPLGGLAKIGRKLNISRTAKEAANQWLRYRYGILPLVSDIRAIARGLKDGDPPDRNTNFAIARVQNESSSSAVVTKGVLNSTVSYSCTSSTTLRAVALVQSSLPQLDRSGLSLKGLVTLPWELIPYSFVADWFLNIGDFLNALVPAPQTNILGSCLVEKSVHKAIATVNHTVSNNPAWTLVSAGTGKVTRTLTRVSRGPLAEPGIVLKADFRFNTSTRLLDAFALTSQKFLRAFRK